MTSDASFMALYKLVTTSWFTTLSWKDTRTREYLETLWDGDVEIESDANLTVKLREASKEVKEVLKVMFFAPEEVMGVFRREVKSHNPRSFLNHVFSYCEISEHDWTRLSKEIYELVS